MVVLIESISSNCRRSCSTVCFERIIFCLIFGGLICILQSEELQIDRNRGRVISTNERINTKNSELLSNSRPNWWQKKVDRKPTLFVNDEPIGTGVPIWKEIDIYGSESRKGRSFAFRSENGSTHNHFGSSLIMISALSLSLFASNFL